MSLDVVGISHRFGNRQVLRDVNFSLEPGTIAAFRGPSGSGKTTLLAIIGGLIKPTIGHVCRPATGPAGMQWIHQTVNVLGRRSALDNVALSLYAQGLTRPEALSRARDALELVGLGAYGYRRVTTLSGGEMQRVSIARALASRPTLVLADEPTGQLDRATTVTVASALLELRITNAIVAIATHDSDVAVVCDRRFDIADGVVTEEP